MLTEKDYCDYKLVLELKELGYDYIRREGLIHLYDDQKWLREGHNLHIDVRLHGIIGYQCEVCTSERTTTVGREFLTYEDALSEGLRKAIEILKILKEK